MIFKVDITYKLHLLYYFYYLFKPIFSIISSKWLIDIHNLFYLNSFYYNLSFYKVIINEISDT